jgi:hypothetical protein
MTTPRGTIMKLTIESIKSAEGTGPVRILVIELKNHSDNMPVLVYLHGIHDAATLRIATGCPPRIIVIARKRPLPLLN